MEPPREAILHIATTADRLGSHAFFLPEGCPYDSTVLLADPATCTQRIQLGSGILGIPGDVLGPPTPRPPPPCMSSKGGASSWGLGASTAQLTEGLHDSCHFAAGRMQLRHVLTQVRTPPAGRKAAYPCHVCRMPAPYNSASPQ